jgi:hypothetical protein
LQGDLGNYVDAPKDEAIRPKKTPSSFSDGRTTTVNSTAEQCPVCGTAIQPPSKFCAFHEAARSNLENAYPAWKKSYDDLTRAEYFDRLEKKEETGRAVKSVIQYLREKGVA